MTKNILIILTVLSFFIRLNQANSYPPLLWDEASLGYNAYSILKTGRDEYGQLLPIIFKSFGDYKPGLYVYLTLPFVTIFGLNPISVRLPSIILGSLLPLFLYLLVNQLSKSKKLSLISAILVAITPYTIHYSKATWETNILTIQLVLACYFFFKKKPLISSLLFASTLYTYQSGKLISLLIIISLTFFNFKQSFSKKFILPLLFLSLPIAYGLFFNNNSNRLQVVSLFSYPRPESEIATIVSESSQANYALLHNQAIFFARNFLTRYFNHFSPEFLFFKGDWQNPRHSAPYVGVLLLPSLIFLPIGIFTKSKFKSSKKFFLFWLLLAPIPAALTRDSVQATRSMSFAIPLIFFSSLGLYKIINKKNILILSSIAYLLTFVYHQELYYNHMVKTQPKPLLYGYQSAIEYIKNNPKKNIYLTNFYGQPYIFYLFFSQYPPQQYQLQAKLVSDGPDTGKIEQIDNIKFSTPSFNSIPNNSLVIYSHDEVLRQNIDTNLLTPLSPVSNYSTFYAYETP